jgi:hypothetical protein
MLDIQIPGIILPKIHDFNTGKVFFANYWITKSGLTRSVYSTNDEIVKLVIPTPWDVVSAYAHAAGYHLENSDKGSIGSELVRLIGGIKNTWIISHPAIINLLLEMSNVNKINEIKKLIRENVQDDEVKRQLINSLPRKSLSKRIMPFSVIKAKLKTGINGEGLDEKSSLFIIEWLLDKALLRQGKTIICNTCLTDNWIPVDKFASTVICNGCLNEVRNPFSINSIEWEYEINTLVSAEIDQGLLVHLLTGFYIFDETNAPHQNGSIYGSFYGIKFVSEDKNKEVDIAFVVDGQFVIGECKVSGREFSAKIIQEYIDFAKEINSPKVIFSCFEHLEELENEAKKISFDDIEVLLLGKDQLFNQAPGLSVARQFHEENPDEEPINRTGTYMKNLEILNDA